MPFLKRNFQFQRSKRIVAILALIGSLSLGIIKAESAGPPAIISYQGRLADAGGNLLGSVSGTTYYFKFSIWDSPTSNPITGNQLWPVTAHSIATTVRQGVFTVNIGDTLNGYPDTLDYVFTNPNVYLQVEVSTNNSAFETLSPRQQLSSTAFAQMAGAVISASSTITNLNNTTFTGTYATITNATSTNLFSNFLFGTNGNITNLIFDLATGTSATTTNFFSTKASTTNLFGTAINGFNLTTCTSASEALTWSGGVFGCHNIVAAGSGGGTWSTTTSQVAGRLINFPNNNTDIVTVGGSATTSAPVYFDPNISLAKIFNQYFSSSSSTLQNFTFLNATGSQATTTNFFSTNLFGTTGFLTNLLLNGSSTFQNLTFANATGSQATTTNLFATTLFSTTHNNSGLGTFGNILASGSSTLQNFTFINATGSQATTTNFFSTNLFGTAGFLTNLLLNGSSTIQNFTFVNATGTSATTTNFFTTNASTSNLFANTLTAGNITSLQETLTNLLVLASSTLQNFTFANATGSQATTTNLFSTTLFSTTHNNSGLGTFGNLLALGSSTLQNFTFVNATGTSATTTNFFATNASTTNLFSNNFTVGNFAAILGTFTNLLVSGSSTLQNFTALNSTSTNATTTSLYNNSRLVTGSLKVFANSELLGVSAGSLSVTGDEHFNITDDISGIFEITSNAAGTVFATDLNGNPNFLRNLGIGSSTPSSLLSISNSVTTPANTPLLTIASTTGGTATTTHLTVLANGNIGIGTRSPINTLDVNMGSNDATFRLKGANAFLKIDGTPATGGISSIQFYDTGSLANGISLQQSGALNITGTFNVPSGLSTLSNLLVSGSSTLQKFTFTNATGSQATTTNFFSTNIFSSILNNSGLATLGNLLTSGSSTLQNFTFINATGTSATTTNFAATTICFTGDTCRTTWPSGAGTSPGGNSGDIQFNNGGNFAGNDGFFYQIATGKVGISTTTPYGALHIATSSRPQLVLSNPSLSLDQKHYYASTSAFGLDIGSLSDDLQNINPIFRIASSTSLKAIQVRSGFQLTIDGITGNGFNWLQTDTTAFYGPANSLVLGADTGNFTFINGEDNSAPPVAFRAGNVGIGTTSPGAQLESVRTSSGATTDTLFLSNQASATNTATRLSFRAQDAKGIATTTASIIGLLGKNFTQATSTLIFSTQNGLGTLAEIFRLTDTGLQVIGSTTLQNFTFVNGTGTSATTTNFFATNASSTNLFYTTAKGGSETLTALLTANNLLALASSTLQNLTFVNATGTSATTTNFFATNASTSNLFANSITVGNITSMQETLTNLLVLGSSTLQNFTFRNATGTNATTTNFFSTTASSTNLFASLFQADGSTLVVDPINHRVGIGTTTPKEQLSISVSGQVSGITTLSLNDAPGTDGFKTLIEQQGSNEFDIWYLNGDGVAVNGLVFNANTYNEYSAGIAGALGSNSSAAHIFYISGNEIGGFDSRGYFSVGGGTDHVFFNKAVAQLEVTGNAYISGNLGIGSTSPWATLSVSQTSGGILPLFTVASSTNGAATSTAFHINAFGNVGIGTAVPNAKLEVVNTSSGAIADALFLSNNSNATGTASRLAFKALDKTGAATTTATIVGQLGKNFIQGTSTLIFSTLNAGALSEILRLTDTGLQVIGSTTLQNLTFVNATGTSATTTNFFATNASTTNLFANTLTVGNITSMQETLTNLLVLGSSTLQNFTFVNATGSQATTTNLFATTLFSTTHNNSGLGTFGNLLISASSTFQNFTFVNATGSQATTTNFFATTASSTNLFATAIQAGTATFNNLLVNSSSTLQNFTFVNATGTSATTTNFFATNASTTNFWANVISSGLINGQTITSAANLTGTLNVTGGLTTLSNLLLTGSSTLQNFTFANATGSQATTTNLFSSNLFGTTGNISGIQTAGNILALGSSTLQNFTFVNATGTSATTTNFFATNASTSNLFVNTLTVGNITSTQETLTNLLVLGSSTLQNFTFVNATGTSATTTNFFSTTASSTNLFATAIQAGTATFNTILANSSSTLQNFTFVNATGTSATTTNFFVTNASTTNLFYTTAKGGSETLTALLTANNILALASSTFQNITFINATGTFATTTNFFSTTASSTNLYASFFQADANTLVADAVNHRVGIGTTAPNAKLEVVNTSSGLTADALFLSNNDNATGTASRLAFKALDKTGAATTTATIVGQLGKNFIQGTSTLIFSTLNAGTLSEILRLTDTGLQVIGSTTLQNFTFLNATGTSATTTNFFSTNASTSNLFANSLTIGNITSIQETLTNLLALGSSTLQNFTFVNATGSQATTTNLFATTLFSTTHNNSGLGTFGNLLVSGSSTLQNFTFANATGTSATTTNLFSTTASSTNLFATAIQAGSATFNNLLVNSSSTLQNFTFVNATGSQATTTNFFATNLFGTTGFLTNLLLNGSTTLQNFTFNNATGTSATTTNFFATNLFGTTGFLTNLLLNGSSTFQNLTFVNATGSQATTTNFFATNLFGTTGFLTNLLMNGSSTLQNFTFINATGTSATTTNFFATNASTTNLKANSAVIGDITVGSCTGCPGGGAGTPSGSGTELQYRLNASTFGAVAGTAYVNGGNYLGIGTATPQWLFQLATATAPQLTLSDASNVDNHWSLRNAGGNLYFATSSPTTFATSSTAILSLNGLTGGVNIGSNFSVSSAGDVIQRGPEVDVRSYGAKCDGQINTNGNSSSNTTLTLADSTQGTFSAGDVGKNIGISNWSGSTVVQTTITGFTNSTTVTVGSAADNTSGSHVLTWGTDDATSINNAIQGLAGTGGIIKFPPSMCLVKSVITLNVPSVTLKGGGRYSTEDIGSVRDIRGTNIVWDGVAGATMFNVTAVSGASNPNLKGVSVQNMTFRGNGMFMAAVGLAINSVTWSDFRDLYFQNFSVAAVTMNVVATLGEARDTARNTFENITIRQLEAGNSAMGMTLDGDSTANTNFNTFSNIQFFHLNAVALKLFNADSNIFTSLNVNRASGGTAIGVELNGSNVSATLSARDNIFFSISPGVGGLIARGSGLSFASVDNYIYYYNQSNGEPNPTVETGATLNWASSSGLAFNTLSVNNTTSDNLLSLKTSGTSKFTVANNGGLTINGTDNGIVKSSTADFAGGTLSNLDSTNGQLELSDGTPSGDGTITTGSQPAVDAAIGSGSFSITRTDGQYLTLKGASTTATSLYNPVANTFTNSQALVTTGSLGLGAGALGLPRPNNIYLVIMGQGSIVTSNVDPMGAVTSTAGPSLTAGAATGTVAMRRADGRFLVTLGASAGLTNIYDPIANTFIAGPTNAGGVTWGAGALALTKSSDGQALIITGGAAATTQLYNPNTTASNIGVFAAGPALPTGCEINNAGSIAIRKQDGKYIVMSKINVSAVYDPTSNTFSQNAGSCTTPAVGKGPTVALADGAHAIPMQDGRYLIIIGGGSTVANVYDPKTDTFTAHATAITAGGFGRHSIMRHDGTWQMLNGSGTGTNKFDTGLVMSGSYTSEAISSTALNPSSVLRWTAQMESTYQGTSTTNGVFSTLQLFVRTAKDTGTGCSAALATMADRELLLPGDLIRPNTDDNCIRLTARFSRPLPKRISDERGVWVGTGNTVYRYDYVTPSLFDLSVDNSIIFSRNVFTFDEPNANAGGPASTSPATSPIIGSPTSGGSCTPGIHSYKVTFVYTASSSESLPNFASASTTCTASLGTVLLSAIPTGPASVSSVIARKIYRTLAGDTSDYFLLTTIADNTTTTFSDTIADTSLGPIIPSGEDSGPIMTRAEAQADRLFLPWGRLTSTSTIGTTGFYGGVMGGHGNLTQTTATSTIVIARPDKRFIIIASGGATTTNTMMDDPTAQVITAQTNSAATTQVTGAGAFAVKRPDGKYLVVMGNSTTATNIYDPIANIFLTGPTLSAAAGDGAMAIQNNDGTFTIVHGNNVTTTSIYDPVRNTMLAGPASPTTAFNCGAMAIPRPGLNQYLIFFGAARGSAGPTATTYYDAQAKTFTTNGSSQTLSATQAVGCGGFAFQRQDGAWVIIEGGGGASGQAQTTTMTYDGKSNLLGTGPSLAAGTLAGGHVIPRADGTFLIINASSTTATQLYIPNGNGTTTGTFVSGTPSLTANAGTGAVSFQRPDGKWVIILGNVSNTVNIYDAGWFSDGQYLSEETRVPALIANSTLEWKQTADNFVRMEVRASTTQAGLGRQPYISVGRPGQSFFNAGGETWVQVEINFRRDFPTWGGTQEGVYVSSNGQTYPYRNVSIPTIFEYKINNGLDLLTLATNGLNLLRVTSNGNIYSSAQGGFFSGGADLAENYTSQEILNPGEVVAIDPLGAHSVIHSTHAYQSDILGVVSTEPGFVAGAHTADSYPIALIGRVPVRISTENGNIKAGDYLTAASIPGYAMKAVLSGRVIGKALEPVDPGVLHVCPGDVDQNKRACGSVMIFLNLIDYTGQSVDEAMSDWFAKVGTGTSTSTPDGLTLGTTTPSYMGDISHQAEVLSFLRGLKSERAVGASALSEMLTERLSAVSEVISPLLVSDMIATGALSVTGKAVFDGGLLVSEIGSASTTLSLLGDVNFFGRPYFTSDTGGSAIVKKGAKTVEIIFDKDYLDTPVVSANIALEAASSSPALEEQIFSKDIRYIVSRKSAHGFTIILNKPAPDDISFSWIALAVKNSKLFTSRDIPAVESDTSLTTQPAPAATSTTTPPIEATSTPPTAPEASSTPTLTPQVEPEIIPVAEATSSPN